MEQRGRRCCRVRSSRHIRCLDAGVGTSLIGVGIRLGRVVVDNLDRFHIHGEGTVIIISLPTGPFNGTLLVVGVTASPDTDLDPRGGLGVIFTVKRIGVVEGSDNASIDEPFGFTRSPIDRIGVECLFRRRDGHCGSTIIRSGVTLAEVVGLDLVIIGTDLFLLPSLAPYPSIDKA